jgi:hypothetical protein
VNRLILNTTMTVDGVISVAEWYVAGGAHDRAARAFDSGVTLLRYEPGDRLASEHGS